MTGAGRRFARNALLNIGGFLFEAAGTIFLVPYVIGKIGLDVYGLVTAVIAVTLATQMLGQAVVAATIRHVAHLGGKVAGRYRFRDELRVTRVGLVIAVATGLLGTVVLVLAPSSIIAWLAVPADLLSLARASLGLLAWILPFMLLSSYLTAVVRGRQEFKTANIFKAVATLLRVAGVVLYFELIEEDAFVFVLLRTSTFVLEGALALVWLLRRERKAAVTAGPLQGLSADDRSMASLIGGLFVFSLGNVLAMEMSKLVVGHFYGLVSLGIVGVGAMAVSFIQRLVVAGAVAINPAVSELDAVDDAERGDRLALEATLVSTVVCGTAVVSTMPAWSVLAPALLRNDVGPLWIAPALMVAAQGSVSSVAPLVQAAYGRGRVIGLSVVHLIGNGLSLAVAFWLGARGVEFVVLIVAICLGRVLTALASAIYLGRSVFKSWRVGDRRRIVLGVVLPWIWAGAASRWTLAEPDPLGSVIVSLTGALIGLALGWRLLLSTELKLAVLALLRRDGPDAGPRR